MFKKDSKSEFSLNWKENIGDKRLWINYARPVLETT